MSNLDSQEAHPVSGRRRNASFDSDLDLVLSPSKRHRPEVCIQDSSSLAQSRAFSSAPSANTSASPSNSLSNIAISSLLNSPPQPHSSPTMQLNGSGDQSKAALTNSSSSSSSVSVASSVPLSSSPSSSISAASSSLKQKLKSHATSNGTSASIPPLSNSFADTAPDAENTAIAASPTYFGHDKSEVSRLILQTLIDLGYSDVASLLGQKSGLSIELPVVTQFRSAILSGDWDVSETLLSNIKLRPTADRKYMSFLIRRQQFLELLEAKDTKAAMTILRTKISTLPTQNPPESDLPIDEEPHFLTQEEIQSRLLQIAQLSNLAMYSPEDITKTLSQDGARSHSRYYLLNSLQELISSDMMIPRHRLATLLTQAQDFQLSRSNYRIKNSEMSLIIDYPDNKSSFPPRTIQLLTEHTDEVWFVNFSHDGRFLATASKDSTVIVWRVSDWSIQARLLGHERGVMCVEWSPDDTMILTSGSDHFALLFDPMTGKKLQVFNEHADVVGSCSWLPSSRNFITASPDKKMILWSTSGAMIDAWETSRILSMAVTPNGKLLISIAHDGSISFCNLTTNVRVTRLDAGPMKSITISQDSRYALIYLETDEIHLWDLETLLIVRKYFQQPEKIVKNCMNEPEKFVLRSCFGGPADNLVLCGSEDGNIYLWNRETTNLIDVIRGHTHSVNCVRFNPKVPDMLASSSDDCTVRIWKF